MNNATNQDNKKFHFDNHYWDSPRICNAITLFQVGDLSCKGSFEIDAHEQSCYEISLIVSGEGIYKTNNDGFLIKEGDIFLNRPKDIHYYKADDVNPFRFFYIGFNFTGPAEGSNPFSHIERMFNRIRSPVAYDKFGIRTLFPRLFNEIINMSMYSSYMMETYVNQIIILSYRSFFENWEKEYSPEDSAGNNSDIIYKIINYIDNNIFEISDLTQIAREIMYSYSYISHLFSKETGLTIKEYYTKKRFEKASELLKSKKMSISEIAEKLNYQSVHAFSNAFHKNMGVSPHQFQTLNNEQKE